MIRPRSRFRNYIKSNSLSFSSSPTYNKNEPYALCFYLYQFFQDMKGSLIFNEYDYAPSIFIKCVLMLEKKERLEKIIEKEILRLIQCRKLKPLEIVTDEMYFDMLHIPYQYEQDKYVDREMRSLKVIDETLTLNISRIMIANDEPVFASLINSTIFRNDDSYELSSDLSLTKSLENKIFDISKTRFMVDQLGLSENEARFILFKCRMENIDDFRRIYRNSDGCLKNSEPNILGITQNEYQKMLRSTEKLREYGFIDIEGDYDLALNDCIADQSMEPYFTDLLKPIDCSTAYELNSYSVPKDELEITLDLLKGNNPTSILFYGKPGSGKTELAKSLCKQSEKKVYMFKNEAEIKNGKQGNVLGRLVCLLSMERKDSVIIVDEADTLIKTLDFSFFGGVLPNGNKGTVNKMLENNRNKVIYIINHHAQIDESTMRRFTFSLKFEAMSQKMLRSIAESKISPMNISSETKTRLLDMLDKYKLTGASAENLVKVIDGMEACDEETLLRKAQIVVKENSLLLYGKTKMRDSVNKEYDLSIINSTVDPNKIITMVENAKKYSEKHNDSESGVRMLFYGLSGTGKTEFARCIADKLHKPILLKRASDILDKYVGESEKNIQDAFEEAERTGSILLFDEADSFCQDRENARNRWEITQVNEFLTQMEEFSGILICTTNLRKIMDPAMQRRFHILSEFKAPSKEGIEKLCRKFFPELEFTEEQISDIDKFKTATPGDFSTLKARYRFMSEDEQTAEYIVSELENLQKEKKKNINSDSEIGFHG